MAKGKRIKSGALRKAAALRAEYRKWLGLFLGVLVLCLIILGIYWLLVSQQIVDSSTLDMLPWFAALVAAGVIGILGNKFSKAHRLYEEHLDTYGMSNSDVVEFLRSGK